MIEEDKDFLEQVAKTVYLAAGYGIGEATEFEPAIGNGFRFRIAHEDMHGVVHVYLAECSKRPHIDIYAKFSNRSRFGAHLYLINDLVRMLEKPLLGNFTFNIAEFRLVPEEEEQ